MSSPGKKIVLPNYNEADKLVNVAMNHIDDAIMLSNEKNEIIYVNRKFEQLTGYTLEEVKGKTPKDLQSGIQEFTFYEQMKKEVLKTGKWQGELWNRKKNGEIYLQSLSIIAVKSEEGKIKNFIGLIGNLFQSKLTDIDEFDNKIYYDSLTSLPKRSLFEKRLNSTLALAKQNKNLFAVVFFQLNNFTNINEQYGFLYGDILLKRIASRLTQNISQNKMITRWDGTTFAVVIEKVTKKEEVDQCVAKINELISRPLLVGGSKISIEANFGAAIYQKNGKEVTDLLSKAHTAMQIAKKHEKKYYVYNENLGEPKGFFIMEMELEKAIQQEEFELYYQPLIDVKTRKLQGFEALIRWNHPKKGFIPPIKFIPLAEETGLIEKIGEFVLEKACQQQLEWQEKGYGNHKVYVNLSIKQFKDKNFINRIKQILKETGVDPTLIGLELTESTLIDDMETTTHKLHELNSLNLSIAIDDFGTGYSSLGYLIDFPIQRLKIDRTFIKVIEKNNRIEAIVAAINTMAESLNIEVVAEGIETESQFEIVKNLGCEIVQGYLFDPPLPTKEIELKWF